nr:hypothetical protein [Rhizobium sp. Root708]
MGDNELSAGFTGTPAEPTTGARYAAKTIAGAVRRETSAVAAGAAGHPHTATGVLVGIAALGICVGYVFGRQSNDAHRYW